MTPIILDTDPGIDDAMAILYAIADPEVELLGLTTVFGNVFLEAATRNALALVELTGADCPVAEGAANPLVQPQHPPPDFVHGKEGFGDASLPAPTRQRDPRPAHQFLAEEIAARPGEITLVAVGPLTNLALALKHDPEIVRKVKNVIVMGGAVRTPGNVNAAAEANIWNDPHAAQIVFAADWSITLVGLDVTEKVHCLPDDLLKMTEKSEKSAEFMVKAAAFYFDFHKREHGIEGSHLHDPTAVIAALDTTLFETTRSPLTVTLEGDEAGMTRETDDPASPAITICIKPDIEAIRARFRHHLQSGALP